MIKKYNLWYQALKQGQQLLFNFLLNWLYWFIAYWIGQKYLFLETKSISYNIFLSLYMSFFMTLIMNWPKVRKLYRIYFRKTESREK